MKNCLLNAEHFPIFPENLRCSCQRSKCHRVLEGEVSASTFGQLASGRTAAPSFTGQQREMIRFIFAQHEHFDAEQLIDEMKNEGLQVSRATIYRTLSKLVDAGLLRSVDVTAAAHTTNTTTATPSTITCTAKSAKKIIEFQDPALDQPPHRRRQPTTLSFRSRNTASYCAASMPNATSADHQAAAGFGVDPRCTRSYLSHPSLRPVTESIFYPTRH